MYALAIDPEEALLDYLEMFYNLKRAGRVLKRFGVVDFATTVAPGMRDVLITGKIKEAVVAGIPQGLRGELIKAYVVLKDGEHATVADILDHCRHDLAKFKVPKKVEFRPELPKTLVGKVLRRVLVEEELKKDGPAQDP